MDAVDAVMSSEGDLRVWHITNPPREPFFRHVLNLSEARDVLDLLADYDLSLGEKMVWGNAQGLEVFEDGEWCEWEDENGYGVNEAC